MSGELEEVKELTLRLGDIIQLEAETDATLHKKQYIIRYIDTNILRLENEDGEKEISINNSRLENDSITNINLLRREEHRGFAKQNGLLPETWVDIFFSLSTPFQITGQIKGLNEDLIEIFTTEQQTIYIDFGYKGIPLDSYIREIIIRNKPVTPVASPEPDAVSVSNVQSTPDASADASPDASADASPDASADASPDASADDADVSTPLVFASDEIIFGEDLGFVKHIVELPESEKRFHIEKQTDDMMDTMLSTIPNANRTTHIINDIHTMINRFKELREAYSDFESDNNNIVAIRYDDKDKPLAKALAKLDKKMYWMLPVATMKKKLYDVTNTSEAKDVEMLTLAGERDKEFSYNNELETDSSRYYSEFKKKLELSTPFADSKHQNYLSKQNVSSNITAIIDNNGDFETSVARVEKDFGKIDTKKFFTQDYIVSQNILKVDSIVPATKNDTIMVGSFLTLPDSTLRFSRINAPSTDILAKVGFNDTYLQYWHLLNNRTRPHTIEVGSESAPTDKFLERIVHYKPTQENDNNNDNNNDKSNVMSNSARKQKEEERKENYRKYLENIVPSTDKLIELVKPHIEGKISVKAVSSYLEPFSVESNEITKGRYNQIRNFIGDKINEFSAKLDKIDRSLSDLTMESAETTSGIRQMFANNVDTYDSVMSGYGITDEMRLSDNEIYSRVYSIDQGRLLNAGISLVSVRLLVLHDSPNIDEYQKIAQEKRSGVVEPDECNKYVLSKKYVSMDEMTEDNKKEIFFDKRYDNTYYELVNEYADAMQGIEEGEPRQTFLAGRLQEVNGLSTPEANRDAAAMLLGKRVIMNGDYAVLSIEDADPAYYKRENEQWILDPEINEGLLTDETKLFCNFNEKCITTNHLPMGGDEGKKGKDGGKKVCEEKEEKGKDGKDGKDGKEGESNEPNKCGTFEVAGNNNESALEKQIISEFDAVLKTTKDDYIKKIMKVFKKAKDNIRVLRLIHDYNSSQKNVNSNVFLTDDSLETDDSPYSTMRDAILGQTDFAKRQQDIRDFITHFTRAANLNRDESGYWLYCAKTNVKLLPSFYHEISSSFIDGEDYLRVMEKICDERGVLGDDGSAWVDKHSGYVIMQRSFAAQEGYIEDGFRTIRQDLLDDNPLYPTKDNAIPGNVIPGNAIPGDKQDETTIMILRVVDAMGKFMRIILDEEGKGFIVRLAKEVMKLSILDKKNYEKMIKRNEKKNPGKKSKSYKDFKNEQIIAATLSYFLVYIQTSIPQIKFGTQYPGCKRAFSGFPINPDSSKVKGIEYVACVASKIKQSGEPWGAISNAKTIARNIKTYLETIVVGKSEIIARLDNKRALVEFQKTQANDDIENTISTSTASLLPILMRVNAPSVEKSPPEFYQSFEESMRTSNKDQHMKVNVLQGKRIHVAVRVQRLIEDAVKNELGAKAVLTNSAEEPYVENACCWDDENRPYEYFVTKVPSLKELNEETKNITSSLKFAKQMSSARILFVSAETKTKFPTISQLYSESTIYRAFATICRDEISDEQQTICSEKDALLDDGEVADNSIEARMDTLRKGGFKYSVEHVVELVASRNAKNTFEWRTENTETANYGDVRYVELANFIDTNTTDPDEMISKVKEEVNGFLEHNLSQKIYESYENDIESLKNGFETDVEDSNFDVRSFSFNCLRYICLLFPSLDSDIVKRISTGAIPKHWELSENHQNDLIKKAESKLEPIENIIKHKNINDENEDEFKEDLKNILEFFIVALDTLPPTTSIKQLFVFCLFKALSVYKNKLDGATENNNTAKLIRTLVTYISKEMGKVVHGYDTIAKKINKAKVNEKMKILSRLENMTDEEREVDNFKKYNKLGKEWGKGLEKNLRIYDGNAYDAERRNDDAEQPDTLADVEEAENNEILMDNDDNPDGDGDESY